MEQDLKSLHIKREYRSLVENLIDEFYVPALSRSILYQRAVGFFSSTALAAASIGIGKLAEHGGKIQIIASPKLSDEDIEAIRQGYHERDKIILKVLQEQLLPTENFAEKKRLNLLANLIAENILDIKIAITDSGRSSGMYHEKMGIFTDTEGNHIAFAGSMNESEHGLGINYEVIDVFRSWDNEDERERSASKVFSFEQLWEDQQERLIVLDFSAIKDLIVEKYKTGPIDYDVENAIREGYRKLNPPVSPGIERIQLYDYQTQAVDQWENLNFRGIFDMATGTGKTFTALSAIQRLFEKMPGKQSVIIVCPYQHLVEQWVEEMAIFNF